MTLDLGKSNTATVEHVIARSLGGGNKTSNRVAACDDCNSAKGSMALVDWLKLNARQVGERRRFHTENRKTLDCI